MRQAKGASLCDYFSIEEDRSSVYTGYINGTHKWGLPGILGCPGCKATWGGGAMAYPSVDLTPVVSLADFEEPRAEPIEEYERLRELVRPLLPPGALVEPGTALGPLVGKAQGRFGPLVTLNPWVLLMQREAAGETPGRGAAGTQGLSHRVALPPAQLARVARAGNPPRGSLAPGLLAARTASRHVRVVDAADLPCPRSRLLDASTIPTHLDLFRLEDFSTVIVCTERFVEACRRLGLDGVSFQPLPTA